MNPLFTGLTLKALKRRLRKCPKCRRQQLAPPGKEDKSIRCNHCKALIPPKGKE